MFSLPPIKEPKSYKKGSNLSFRVREFDPTALEVIENGNTHDRYNCPYCLEVRGKEDDDGKFYWDREKLIGWCFKCEVTGIIKSDSPIDEVRLEVALISLVSNWVGKDSSQVAISEIPYEKLFMPLDDEGKDYLVSRVPLYSEFFDKLKFRVNPKVGVAVPILIDDKIISYNLRFYDPPGKMKYYIPNGTKFLYSPTNIINTRNKLIEITLVEGYFDAVGALLDGYTNPVAMFGKTMTPFQISLIRKVLPSKINIYLDEAKLSWNLYYKLRDHFPTVAEWNIVPTNYDPEERLKFRLGRTLNEVDMKKLFDDINNALVSLDQAYIN